MRLPTRAVADEEHHGWVSPMIRADRSKANLLPAISCKATRLLPAERPAFAAIAVAPNRPRTAAVDPLRPLQSLPVRHLEWVLGAGFLLARQQDGLPGGQSVLVARARAGAGARAHDVDGGRDRLVRGARPRSATRRGPHKVRLVLGDKAEPGGQAGEEALSVPVTITGKGTRGAEELEVGRRRFKLSH